MRRIAIAPCLAALFFGLAAVPALANPTLTPLHVFDGADGANPIDSLIQGSDGLLYGETMNGGGAEDGNLFKIDIDGNNFDSFLEVDGQSSPFGETPDIAIEGTDGNLYGITGGGGANNLGTVFKVAKDGSGYTDLFDFDASGTDPFFPSGPVIQGSDGNLYGVTTEGGTNNLGTVYKISITGGTPTVLYSFGTLGPNDLSTPAGNLVEGEDGSLYGTAQGGPSGDGGVYRINLDGTGYTVLHAFVDAEGGIPESGVIQGGDGFLYGTANSLGANRLGAIYKVATDGSGFQTMHNFAGVPSDGSFPFGPLVLGNDGNLYGTAAFGGADGGPDGVGTIFEISRDGLTYNTLHSFAGTDGANPQGGLLQGTDGAFYGTTKNGSGVDNDGTVFSFATGLPASPTGVSALGFSAQVQIHWTNDTNAVTYNLYRSTTSGAEGSTPYQTGLTGTSFSDNGVSQGTQYFYKLTAVDAGSNESAKSYEVAATPQMGIAASGGLSATPNPAPAGAAITGTLTLVQATTGPTTAFVSSDNPNVTFTNPDVTVPSGHPSTTFAIDTANTGSSYTADITASENGTDATTTITVNVPSILHTYQPGLQMIAANTNDTGTTLANDFAESSPELAVWTGSTYAISPAAPANTIVPGQGYWFHPTSAANLYDIGTDVSDGATVTVPLSQGWNMIGNPFDGSISGSDLAVQNGANTVSWATANSDGLIGDTLYTLQPGDNLVYETQPAASATLAPYEGYWLYAFQPCTLSLKDLP